MTGRPLSATLTGAQLPLGLKLRDGATFANFLAGPNAAAVDAVRGCADGDGERFVYLAGPAGAGKSHLLQAACRLAGEAGGACAYLPLAEVPAPEALEGLEVLDLVCLDDFQVVAGRRPWEEAVFHFFNRWWEGRGRLVVAAQGRPAELGLGLADLRSRMEWGLGCGLRVLDDGSKIEALRLRARARGLDLPDEVGRYLLRRLPRDLGALFDVLDRLDDASLVAQRRLTVPFIKEVLGV